MRYDAGEVITAMVTPFNEKREVDYDKVEELAKYLVNTGSDAVLVTGTTGEAPTLTYDEEIEILCKDDKYAIVKFDNTRAGALLLYDEVVINWF